MKQDERDAALARVNLFWLPLGAGDASRSVRMNGLVFEAITARHQKRDRQDLFHAALEVQLGTDRWTIEMAPVWGNEDAERGVVCEGPVWASWLGRSRYFRYEVRRWRDGRIPDASSAVDSPLPVSTDAARAQRLLAIVPSFPALRWGRDPGGTGDMWNSNSLVAWLLAGSGHDVSAIEPPHGGRAPGWHAGLALSSTGSVRNPADGLKGGQGRDRTADLPRPATTVAITTAGAAPGQYVG